MHSTGFLGAVPPGLLVLRVTERVIIGNFPDRHLLAVTAPMAALALAHSIPAGFMLPMIIAAAQCEVLLDPDDLSAKPEPAGGKVGGDDIACRAPCQT
jgi:hypothetical protein